MSKIPLEMVAVGFLLQCRSCRHTAMGNSCVYISKLSESGARSAPNARNLAARLLLRFAERGGPYDASWEETWQGLATPCYAYEPMRCVRCGELRDTSPDGMSLNLAWSDALTPGGLGSCGDTHHWG